MNTILTTDLLAKPANTMTRRELKVLQTTLIFGDQYDLPARDLQSQVTTEDLNELMDMIRVCESYNNFSAQAVNQVLERHRELLDKAYSFEFGREGSPVLYVKCSRSADTNAIRAFATDMVTHADVDECSAGDFDLFTETGEVTEQDWSDPLRHTLRFWWD